MEISKRLEKFLLTELAPDFDKKSIKMDEDILELGIIDSLGIMKLISFMEDTYGIEVTEEEIVPENFQSLNIMVQFIEQKRKEK
jgi:acyl carrier protein